MKLFNFLLCALFFLSITSCSNNDTGMDPIPEVTLADFSGSWIATTASFTKNNNTSETTDFIAVGGHMRYTAFDDGRFRTWVDFQDVPLDEWDAQAALKDGKKLMFTPADDERDSYIVTYEFEENKIIFSNSDAKFDFSLSGEEGVSATSVITFIPN